MGQRLLGALLAVIVMAILLGSRARRDPPVPPAAPVEEQPAVPPPPREVSVRPYPGASDPLQGTPTIDLLAALTIRRRIEREGLRVYLSALLAQTDSLVVRWPDRTSRSYTVFFEQPDTSLTGWSPAALADAMAGLQLWQGNSAGISLVATSDTAGADITVRWTASTSKPGEAGNTSLQWDGGGNVTHGDITLALGLDDGTPLTSQERRRTAGHEFGHALGLPHSPEPEDFMFARTELDGPSRRDQATLLLLYAIPTGSIRTP